MVALLRGSLVRSAFCRDKWVVVSTAEAKTIDPVHLNPIDTFRSWKGIAAKILSEMVPVQPVVVFDKSDRRLIEGRDVLSQSRDAQNLARHKRHPDARLPFNPQLLFGINWATSGPGFEWPEDYRVTYIPGLEKYIFTASRDVVSIGGALRDT